MNDPRNWRDARLKKALESAPDEAARPADAVREAILNKARATAAAADARPRKPARRWFDLGMPWNSALASLFLIGFVTVLWTTQKPPPEVLQVQVQAPAPRPLPLQASAPTEIARTEAQLRAAAKAEARDTIRVPRTPNPLPPVPIIEPETPQLVAPSPATITLPAAAPAPARVAMPPPAMTPAPAPAPAPAFTASHLAAPAPASTADSAPQYVSVMGARARARAETGWTELLVLEPTGRVRWTPDQLPPQALAQIQSMLDATPTEGASDEAKPEPPQLRLQIRHGEQLLGYLELGPTEARWISVDGRIVLTRPPGLPKLMETLRSR